MITEEFVKKITFRLTCVNNISDSTIAELIQVSIENESKGTAIVSHVEVEDDDSLVNL